MYLFEFILYLILCCVVLFFNFISYLVKLADELEIGCLLLGATGVEDKLQDQVPDTIHDFLLARMSFYFFIVLI